MEKKFYTHYEIRSYNDFHGLWGRFESEQEALDEINRSYEYAKKRGYDNRDNKWLIVCVQSVVERGDNGEFMEEKINRFAVSKVEYSTYENAFARVEWLRTYRKACDSERDAAMAFEL